jgi:hypothetical protein
MWENILRKPKGVAKRVYPTAQQPANLMVSMTFLMMSDPSGSYFWLNRKISYQFNRFSPSKLVSVL